MQAKIGYKGWLCTICNSITRMDKTKYITSVKHRFTAGALDAFDSLTINNPRGAPANLFEFVKKIEIISALNYTRTINRRHVINAGIELDI